MPDWRERSEHLVGLYDAKMIAIYTCRAKKQKKHGALLQQLRCE